MIPAVIMAMEDESDREFMTRIYMDYEKLMYSEINKVCAERGDAEDIVNDSLVKLIEKIPLLRSLARAQLVNYIITTVRNTATDYFRRDSHFSPDNYETAAGDRPSDGGTVEDTVLEKIDAETFRRMWPSLDETTRAILEKKYVLGQDDREIAQSLGIKPASVRMALTRARSAAYEQLKAYME